jgi:hypothetical protein
MEFFLEGKARLGRRRPSKASIRSLSLLFFSFFPQNILPPYYAVPEVIIATWL